MSTCSKCGGDGKIITDKCRKCIGSGRLRSRKKLDVVIPPGVSDRATMRIQGEGNMDTRRYGRICYFQLTFFKYLVLWQLVFFNMVSNIRSGRAGDLFIVLQVDEKRGIQREGLNLYSNINIDFTDAILGTITKVVVINFFLAFDATR